MLTPLMDLFTLNSRSARFVLRYQLIELAYALYLILFTIDYQRYYGDSAMRNRELRGEILDQVSSLIATENAKQQEILADILTEIRSLLQSNGSSLDTSPHTSNPTIEIDRL